jgi:hydroxyquinol 1,2-dioxygenase
MARGRTSPEQITEQVVASFADAPPRLRELMTELVRHLHRFVVDVRMTADEWQAAISVLTATGHITDARRQEFILWSDSLGVSMLVDALEHDLPEGATESTVLGPFFVPNSPLRKYGDDIATQPAGDPVWVSGRVLAIDGEPIAGAELDVWQNGDNRLYAVQDPDAPEEHLRGRFLTRDDGTYAFLAVRPVPYPIPFDGPVGRMLSATGRHPWRPAHIHLIVRAPGYRTLTTHIFDSTSEYLDSDAVFAVKPSLLREFVRRAADDPLTPPGVTGDWYSVENDLVLAPGEAEEPTDPGRTA